MNQSSVLGQHPVCYLDSPDATSQTRPPIIGVYRPDLFAQSSSGDYQIVGEAKTPRDLESTRSYRQLQAFVLYVASKTNRAIVIATQWDYVRYARTLLKNICHSNSIPLVRHAVMDQFGNTPIISDDWL